MILQQSPSGERRCGGKKTVEIWNQVMAHGALTIIVNCYFDNLQTQTEAADQSYNHNIRVGFTVNSMIRGWWQLRSPAKCQKSSINGRYNMFDVGPIVTPSEQQRRSVTKCPGPGDRAALVADGGNGHILLAAHSSPTLTTTQQPLCQHRDGGVLTNCCLQK